MWRALCLGVWIKEGRMGGEEEGYAHLGEFGSCASSDFLCAEGAEFGFEVDELRF